jgi:2-octaprenyl-6-methoxyphenol hydroxylase
MQTDFDVIIAGGGYIGLTLASALRQADSSISIAVVDPRPIAAASNDGRASAIAAAARKMYTYLGVWSEMQPAAQPITEMIVTDSRLGDSIRPVYLTFAGESREGEPFAHMIPNGVMVKALGRRATELGVRLLPPASVANFRIEPGHVAAELSTGQPALNCRLLVAADGIKSRLRSLAGIRTVDWDYGQSGIVATIRHERPHGGRAEEHFLPAGPFAILPLADDTEGRHRSSLVWTERTRAAEKLVALDDFTFRLELERRFGHHLGDLEVAGPRAAYPLGLKLARDWVKPRFALAGDAAHGIHPIAGQGLNLGLRDVAALAEVIVEASRLGLDIGALDVLERYQTWRRFDAFEMGVVTDTLNRLFSNDFAPLRMIRDFGLGVVDRLPKIKQRFIGEAAGTGGGLPRLLRGEAI